MPRRLTTAEAAARLGVKPATLYAYVSRGLLRRERGAHGSTFAAADVERLATASHRGARGPTGPMAFVTELTLIEGGRLRYRGLDAVDLSRRHGFEAVAGWLWDGDGPVSDGHRAAEVWVARPEAQTAASAAQRLIDPAAQAIDRYTLAVAVAATCDPLRHDRSPATVAAVGRAVVALMVGVLPPAGASGGDEVATVAGRLWSRLTALTPTPERIAALDAALVLLADHELAASTLAARVAASFGADPYAVIGTGLGAVSGTAHGAASIMVQGLFERAEAVGAARAMTEQMRRSGSVPGLGMVLYPDGDPRGAELLRRVRILDADPDRLALIEEIAGLAAERGMPAVNVDFGLGALAFACHMVADAGEAVFAPARVVGWIAHAREEYADRTSFRARATYVGPR